MPDLVDTVTVDGRARSFACHVPTGVSALRPPLLLVLHGRRITGTDMRRWTGFDALADQQGFVVAYPEGVQRSWNDGRENTPATWEGIDDVGFIRHLIDHLGRQVGVDPERVGVAGLSNGGSMCHRLALELGERVAAIAPVAGLMPASLASVAPAYAVSVLLVHGTADRFQPLDGGRPSGRYARLVARLLRGRRRGGPLLSLDATAARWRAIDRIQVEPGRSWLPAVGADPTRVERVQSGPGHAGTAVECCLVHGGDHT